MTAGLRVRVQPGAREGAVRVVRGQSARGKTIEVDGLDERAIAARVTAALEAAAAGRT